MHQDTASPHRIASTPTDAGVPSPRRVGDFTHVRSVHASRGNSDQNGREGGASGGRRSESRGQNLRLTDPISGRAEHPRSQSGGVWRNQWSCAEAWSLEPSVWGEAEESEGDASWERSEPAVLRRAARSCTGRGRAGENSPASAKQSEVIGLQNSSSSAEEWMGSYKEHQL